MSERTATTVAHISRESQLVIDRDQARREFRGQQVRPFLEHANRRLAPHRRAVIAAAMGDVGLSTARSRRSSIPTFSRR